MTGADADSDETEGETFLLSAAGSLPHLLAGNPRSVCCCLMFLSQPADNDSKEPKTLASPQV